MYVTMPCHQIMHQPCLAVTKTPGNAALTHLKAGTYLYFEGDEVDWIYQIRSGVLRLTRLLEDGRRQVIAFGYPGDIVGFPSDGLHHTDCDALTDAELHPYRRSALENGDTDPELHQMLLQAALREISAMQDHFMMLGRKSAVEKVASFLAVLSDRFGDTRDGVRQVDLAMSRVDIADFLGLTTETVSRTFTQLRKSKIIAIENTHTIKVLRPVALLGLTLGDRDL